MLYRYKFFFLKTQGFAPLTNDPKKVEDISLSIIMYKILKFFNNQKELMGMPCEHSQLTYLENKILRVKYRVTILIFSLFE